MAYTEHNFTSGSILYADDLNVMDQAIAKMYPYADTAEFTITKVPVEGVSNSRIIRLAANNLTPNTNYVIKVVRNARTHGRNTWFVQNDNKYGYAQMNKGAYLDWMYNNGYLKASFPFSTGTTSVAHTSDLDIAAWLTDLCIPCPGSSIQYQLMGLHGRPNRSLKFTFYLYNADETELIAKADSIISIRPEAAAFSASSGIIPELSVQLIKIK